MNNAEQIIKKLEFLTDEMKIMATNFDKLVSYLNDNEEALDKKTNDLINYMTKDIYTKQFQINDLISLTEKLGRELGNTISQANDEEYYRALYEATKKELNYYKQKCQQLESLLSKNCK